jgi:hypothetical protein
MGTSVAVRRQYTLEEKELALRMLALSGVRYEQTINLLNEHTDLKGVAKQTIEYWAKVSHRDRFEEIRTEVSSQVAQRVANQAEQIMLAIGDVELLALQKTREQLEAGEAKDPAAVMRNLATAKALNNDKISAPVRGRPTVIHADRSADEIMRALKALEPNLIIEGTAEEVEDPPSEARSLRSPSG